jgi:hypothetical protein
MATTPLVKKFLGWGFHPTADEVIDCGEHATIGEAEAAVAAKGLKLAEVEHVWRSAPTPVLIEYRMASSSSGFLDIWQVEVYETAHDDKGRAWKKLIEVRQSRHRHHLERDVAELYAGRIVAALDMADLQPPLI